MKISKNCKVCWGVGVIIADGRMCECIKEYIKHLEEHQYEITPPTKKTSTCSKSGWDDMDDGSKIKLKVGKRDIEVGKCSLCGRFGCGGHGHCCK